MMQTFHRVVVKVGASVLTHASGEPDTDRFARIVEQLAVCLRERREVVLVSSGAIACGMGRLGLTRRPKDVAQLQACAAIGQSELMRLYSDAFGAQALGVAQVLLTQADLADRTRCRNAKNTLQALLRRQIVPIVNENDAVAVEEITFGDNDRLAALVASLLEAQLLVILSDVDGVLERGRLIGRIDELNHHHQAIALGPSRETSTGGMASKLAAARIVRHAGIPMVIANGTRARIVLDILQGKPVGTLIAPPSTRLKFHKWWIAFAMRRASGMIVVDAGAAEALLQRGKSLLASGIQDVRGRFHAGDPVAIVDEEAREVARGVSNYSSSELARIQGLKSARAAQVLGRKTVEEVVHRDNLVLTKDLQ